MLRSQWSRRHTPDCRRRRRQLRIRRRRLLLLRAAEQKVEEALGARGAGRRETYDTDQHGEQKGRARAQRSVATLGCHHTTLPPHRDCLSAVLGLPGRTARRAASSRCLQPVDLGGAGLDPRNELAAEIDGIVEADRSRGSETSRRRAGSIRRIACATCSGVPTRHDVLPSAPVARAIGIHSRSSWMSLSSAKLISRRPALSTGPDIASCRLQPFLPLRRSWPQGSCWPCPRPRLRSRR